MGNTANTGGGGIDNSDGTATINNSTISGNEAITSGGGIINNQGIATISNSTISGNTANSGGGGISNFSGTATINNSTISGNTANSGGGIDNSSPISTDSPPSTVNIVSTIVAVNTASTRPDVPGIFIDQGNNLIGDVTGSTGFTVSTLVGDSSNLIDPLLGALQDNGGSTFTQALLTESPAIDGGSNPNDFSTDQRGTGFLRELSSGVDIGAFEFQPNNLLEAVDDPDNSDNQGFTTDEDTAFTTANVLDNDISSNVEDPLSIDSIDTSNTQGLVTDNGDGTFDYDPNGQFESLNTGEIATDRFIYTVTDNGGETDSATVEITINGIDNEIENNPPILGSTTLPNIVVAINAPNETISLTGVFEDPDGDHLTISFENTNPGLATATINGDDLILDFVEDQSGIATITLEGTDPSDASVQTSFEVTVNSPPTPPPTPTPTPTPISTPTPTPTSVTSGPLLIDPTDEIPEVILPTLEENPDVAITTGDGSNSGLIVGTNEVDNILGSSISNRIYGQRGTDFISGNTGGDTVFGGQGNDQIQGGLGNDSIFGNLGQDTVSGQRGSDWINGNQGDDFLNGSSGVDTLFGGKNNDTLVGGEGRDQLFGNLGEDRLEGNGGNDLLYGGQASDTVSGNNGNDSLSGEQGDDLLDGNMGQDTLTGGQGNDTLDGGEGKLTPG